LHFSRLFVTLRLQSRSYLALGKAKKNGFSFAFLSFFRNFAVENKNNNPKYDEGN